MLNKIVIMGRLTSDPEIRSTRSGATVANFTLAVDRDYTGNDGERATDFVDCVAWRNTADFVGQYFHKGQMAVVSGRLESSKWEDRDGNRRTSWAVVADSVYFGESKRETTQATVSPPKMEELEDDDGELPF